MVEAVEFVADLVNILTEAMRRFLPRRGGDDIVRAGEDELQVLLGRGHRRQDGFGEFCVR